jgi:hypothetical protein
LRDEIKRLPAVPDMPFEQMDDATQLRYLARRSRTHLLDVINLPNKLSDFEDAQDPHAARARIIRIQTDAAQNLQSAQIKVDEGQLRHVERTDLIAVMREEMKNIPIPSK